MLREIKASHLQATAIPFSITTTATPTITASTGSDDLGTITRTSAGQFTVNLKRQAARNLIVVGQPLTTNGGYMFFNSIAPTISQFAIANNDSTGGTVDGSADFLAIRYMSTNQDFVPHQRMRCTQDRSRIIWGRITGATGAVAIGLSDFTVTRVSTGLYTIVYRKAFGRTPIVLITPIATSGARGALVSNKTAAGCTITIGDNNPTVQDTDFYILVCGTDNLSQIGNSLMPLLNSQRKSRILAGKMLLTGTTPSISVNAIDFTTPVRNGAGDYSIPISTVFKRECAFFATSLSGKRINVHTGGSGTVRYRTSNSAGTDGDMTTGHTTDFIMIGSNDVSEY